MTGLRHNVFLICLLATYFGPVEPAESGGQCPSPQEAEIGHKGIIECSLPLNFKGLVWYNSTDTNTDSMVARIERQDDGSLRISGECVNTGSYTIPSNGSLIIPEVTPKHERKFKVLIIDEEYDMSWCTIEFRPLMYPNQSFPEVNFKIDLVFVESENGYANLSCSFQHVRPAVTLSWFKFNKGKFETFEAPQYNSSEDGLSFSSVSNVTIDIQPYNSLQAFSCRAGGPAVGNKEVRTDVLVSDRKCHTVLKTVYLEPALEIPCTVDGYPRAFIWQFEKNDHSQIFMLYVDGKEVKNETNSKMDVSSDGSLIFAHVDRDMTGVYTCFFLVDNRSDCNNVELQVNVPERMNTEDREDRRQTPAQFSAPLKSTPWEMITLLVGMAFVLVLLLFFYAYNEFTRHRNVKTLGKMIGVLLKFRFETITDSKVWENDAINVLRIVSKDIEEYREIRIPRDCQILNAGIRAEKITLPGAVFLTFTKTVEFEVVVAREAKEVEESEKAAGAEQSIGYSLENLIKDKDSVNSVKPALEAFISIQRDLAEIVVLLAIAYKVAGSKKWRRRLSRKILKQSESFLQDIQAMQSSEKESFDQILSNIKNNANGLVKIATGPEFETKHPSDQTASQWESFLQENPRKPFDYLEEAVKTLLQEHKDLNGTPTLVTFVKQLYGNLPDSTAVERIEGNTHAANVLSDDGSIVGGNVSKTAKGVSAVGVVLRAVGVEVDLEFLGEAACNILGEEREQFSSALRDACDVMEKINNIASQIHSVQDSSVFINPVAIDCKQESATSG